MALDDAEELGFVGIALLVVAFLPLVVLVAALAGTGYLMFLGGRGIARWVVDQRQPDPLTLMESDYQRARTAMNEVAGQSWRNLADRG